MSVLNQSGEEQVECPLCMEPLEVDDLHFYPCTCGYQICRFCWNRIREGENGLCPACRKAYPENPADFTPLSQEQVAAIKTEKKAREQKRRNKTLESRRALANVRVVQNNLVFVVGLPVRLADPETLKRQEYFGKYGKIHKVVINQSTTYAGSQAWCQGPSASAYVTYVSSADALRAIQGVNNVTLDGRVLKGSLGTTKYCANFMKNLPCPKPDCMYLHELGDPKASFTKEEMHAGLHQVYERKLHNQLINLQRDKPTDDKQISPGNSSTSAEKSSSKDGNQSNFIPTTVVTSSHINIVNSSKSNKKDSVSSNDGNGKNCNSNGVGNGNSSNNGKEAWPSLGSTPPTDSPARKQSSPQPQQSTFKSQENSTSESSSPIQQTQIQTSKNKEHTDKSKTTRSKDITNGQQSSKKSKSENRKKNSNSNSEINEIHNSIVENKELDTPTTQSNSVFESETQQNYLSNELDELESDRHSLLENHDLLDNSDHSLLEDDTHNLLNDRTNEINILQRHREMLAGLVDSKHNMLPQIKNPIVNGYGIIDRDIMSYLGDDRQISQINNQTLMEQKELQLRDRSRSEMLLRNELLARQHNVMIDSKHYMPTPSIGLESASELLGANYHQNPNMLPPFGMRVDNSLASSSIGNAMAGGSMSQNALGANMNALGTSSMSSNSMVNNSMAGYMMPNQQMLHNQSLHSGLVNGYDNSQAVNEGRYLAENMDKFFTDFHKAQQMRLVQSRVGVSGGSSGMGGARPLPHNVLSAERLEMEHKHRMGKYRGADLGCRAAGDGDDDLDFDPFNETQKAFAEMMETEILQNSVSSGDNMERVRRARLPPPGFAHIGNFGVSAGVPRAHSHHQGFTTNNAMFSDWTQMDPAIMSTSVNFGKGMQPQQQQAALSQQQQELFARFNQLGMQQNGVNKLQVPLMGHQWAQSSSQKLPWTGVPQYNNIPLPPGFAPPKPPQHPAECIDAK